MATELGVVLRRLRFAIEPLAGCAYFSEGCTRNYQALGFGPSPGSFNGVGCSPAYHESRTALLGEVHPSVAAAVFPQFGPESVRFAVERRQSICDAATLVSARQSGVIAQLQSVFGVPSDELLRLGVLLRRAAESVDVGGRPFAAAVVAQGFSGDPIGDVWHAAEILREHRGDAHVAAWVGRGLSGAEVQVLSAAWLGMGEAYLRSWDWPMVELDSAAVRLEERGLLRDGEISDAGRLLRDEIEQATDVQCSGWFATVADDVDELLGLARSCGAVIRESGSYPTITPDYFEWFARTVKGVAL